MCFAWTHAVGFTPIWECGTLEDRRVDTATREGPATLKQLTSSGIKGIRLPGGQIKYGTKHPGIEVYYNPKGDHQAAPPISCKWGHYCLLNGLDATIARHFLRALRSDHMPFLKFHWKTLPRRFPLRWDERWARCLVRMGIGWRILTFSGAPAQLYTKTTAKLFYAAF